MATMAELTKQVALTAQVDFKPVAEALDPLGTRNDPKPDLDALKENADRLDLRINGLQESKANETELEAAKTSLADAVKKSGGLQTDIDDLKKQVGQAQKPTLTEQWNRLAMEAIPDRKSFLIDKIKERLPAKESREKLAKGMKDGDSFGGVSGSMVRSIEAVPDNEKNSWKVMTIKLLLSSQEKLLKDLILKDEHRAFWRDLHELNFLAKTWQTEAIIWQPEKFDPNDFAQ